jgi:hypothetical protein
VNTRDWPPFINGMFAYLFGQGLAILAVRFLLGDWPDDPLLLLPHMTAAYGVAGGAIATAIAFAPAVSWSRRAKAGRPWVEIFVLTSAAVAGSLLLLTVLLGSFLLEYVPAMTMIAAALSAIGATACALAYWMLAGRPR